MCCKGTGYPALAERRELAYNLSNGSNDMEKIGFIGMGNMATAIARGFIKSGSVPKENVRAFAPNQTKLAENAKNIGFTPCGDIIEMVKDCDTLIMACKPYQIRDVLAQIQGELTGKALISIAAGWVFDTYHDMLGDKVKILCIMPNTPAMVGQGVILFEQKTSFTDKEIETARALFGTLGLVETLPTSLMGIGGAISGCGPAFMDVIMEAYADAAVKYGISRDLAYRLVSQTMLGSARLQQVTGSHPGVLKDAVCSPNGTTIRGVDTLEKNGVRGSLISSIDAIMDYKLKK